MKKLALDLGIGSIGYALIDTDARRILEANSIIVKTKENKKGDSALMQRRLTRAQRRLIARAVDRKKRLEKVFKMLGVYKRPDDIIIPKEYMDRFAEYLGSGHELIGSQAHAVWFIRHIASTEVIPLELLYKVLYHMAQNRGFNYEDEVLPEDTKQKNEDTEQKKYAANKKKFRNISEKYSSIAEWGLECIKTGDERTVNKVVHRDFYKEEMLCILQVQGGIKNSESDIEPKYFISENGSEELKGITPVLYKNNVTHRNMRNKGNLIDFLMDDVIYYQRPLKSQKNKRGKCPFVRFKDTYGKSHPKTVCNEYNIHFQEFRLRKTILNFFKDITTEQADALYRYLNIEGVKSAKGEVKVSVLADLISEETDSKESIKVNSFHRALYLNKVSLKDIKIIAKNHSCNKFIQQHLSNPIKTKKEKFISKMSGYGISVDSAENIFSMKGSVVWAAYSEKAYAKINKFIREGDNEYDATNKAYPNIEVSDPFELIPDSSYMNNSVRKVVNTTLMLVKRLQKEYGDPDMFIIETNREFRMKKTDRDKYRRSTAERRKENILLDKEIMDIDPSIPRTSKNRLRLRLWKSQGMVCMYSGETIKKTKNDLFGSGCDLDHIIPRAKGGENSYTETYCVLSKKKVNKEKTDTMPLKFMETFYPDEVSGYKERVKAYKKTNPNKHNRLLCGDKSDFENSRKSHSTGTSNIVKFVGKRLKSIFPNAEDYRPNGWMTNFVRSKCGISSIFKDIIKPYYDEMISSGVLSYDDIYCLDGKGNTKFTTAYDKHHDNRNHAMDALVLCYFDGKLYDSIRKKQESDPKGWEDSESLIKKVKEPYNNFKGDIREVLEKMIVEYKKDRKLTTKKKTYNTRIIDGKKVRVYNNTTITPKKELHDAKAVKVLMSHEKIKARKDYFEDYVVPFFKDFYSERGFIGDCIETYIKDKHQIDDSNDVYTEYIPFIFRTSNVNEKTGELKISESINVSAYTRIGKHYFGNGATAFAYFNDADKENIKTDTVSLFDFIQDKTFYKDMLKIYNGQIIDGYVINTLGAPALENKNKEKNGVYKTPNAGIKKSSILLENFIVGKSEEKEVINKKTKEKETKISVVDKKHTDVKKAFNTNEQKHYYEQNSGNNK